MKRGAFALPRPTAINAPIFSRSSWAPPKTRAVAPVRRAISHAL
jgi:hypothetical protein